MKKYKYLLKNVGLLTLSNFGSKLLSFFLVPLYTSILTTTEYGTYDLLYTTMTLLIPILTINISEAALRFALDKKTDNSEVFGVSVKNIIIATLVFLALVGINYIFDFVKPINEYVVYFILFFITHMIFQLIQSFCRGIDNVFDLAVSGIINSAVVISLNILFLVYLKWGISGYFIANILSNFVATLYIAIRIRIHKYIKIKEYNKKLEKEMIKYSKPMVLNSISWWITNASDRYIVTWLCGVSENGIYSVRL